MLCCLGITGLLWLYGCSSPSSDSASGEAVSSEMAANETEKTVEQEAPVFANLEKQGSMELAYAENFGVDYYEGGYEMLRTVDGTQILLVPEGEQTPTGLESGTIVLERPVSDLYLVSSGVMDMFRELDALSTIRFSAQKEENWYIEEAREAMAQGTIRYAGKYNRPDYEQIVSEGCSLAIENRMILHAPEVMEKLQEFGIPVMIEYSSYEKHPLGRVEWIRFFGALTGREKEAEEAFEKQKTTLEQVAKENGTDKTAAFFYITSNGLVQVRQSTDYIPKMIEIAGGTYVPEDAGDPDSGRSTMNMQIEDFYDKAREADFLIYNSSIDGGIKTLEELTDKCSVLKDFKAVQEGNVFCTTNDMYQQSMAVGQLTEDIHRMLMGKDEQEMTYLFRLR